MNKFVVSYAPFVRSSNDINKMFVYTSIMLVFPLVYGCFFFGFFSLLIALASIATCFLAEALFNVLTTKKFKVNDLSFLVSGLILGLTMPVKMPIYIVIVSAFFANFVVKMLFGGLGKNKFNPAVVGRLFAGILVSGLAVNLYDFTLNGETYTSFTNGGENSILNLLTGKAIGGIGTTCIIIMLISYAFLVYMSVIDWKIPLLSVLSYFVVSFLLCGMEQAVLNICSGSFLFVCVFMMTDPNTSASTFLGKLVYSIMFGALSAWLWNIGLMGEETVFVVALIVDALVPFMDKYLFIKQKPLGGYRYASKN
ncbi:MAG: RnfABCDGE type electron transport complex subunit D [Clostridia bacterium]|nr:RnfABCDGE type electron transport complex subunit D [Clostridia bacterium]